MHTAQFQATKLTAILPMFFKLMPVCRFNRDIPKACFHYGNIKPNHINEVSNSQPRCLEQTHVIDNRNSLADKLKDCKTHLTNCAHPVEKYEYLANLRDRNIELYYQFLCNNTAEVFSVLTAVDGVADKFYRFGTMIINRIRREDVEQMDVSSTVDFLRKKVNDQKGAPVSTDVGTTTETENIVQGPKSTNFVETSDIKQQFMLYLFRTKK